MFSFSVTEQVCILFGYMSPVACAKTSCPLVLSVLRVSRPFLCKCFMHVCFRSVVELYRKITKWSPKQIEASESLKGVREYVAVWGVPLLPSTIQTQVDMLLVSKSHYTEGTK